MSDDNDVPLTETACNSISVGLSDRKSSGSSESYYELPAEKDPSSQIEYDVEEAFVGDVNEDIDENTSVISHLLSQVKIGMDLTKVTLPTFILERRSLLEMFAEFFAHPNYFTEIQTASSPLERMLRIVKFYLSSFHAGRKGVVAKKPYNPVLGETFKCFFKINEDSESCDPCNGPLPWVRAEDVSFIAEQVSHHPPISAIYAESEKYRVCFNCHLWTKSKFLGLSIGVHNIGKGTVYLLDHNESYVCTFPSAYGRNILGRPWFELGGECSIYSPETGMKCEIEFVPKPFFGGKKHTISGKLFDTNSNTIYYTISGKWNGVMKAKSNDGEEIVLVNTLSEDVYRKYVRALSDQESNESRVIWKEVSTSLKNRDIKLATKYKTMIEDNQRRLVKERAQNNEIWTPKYFTKAGDNWVYNNMLYDRISHNFTWKNNI